MNGTDRALAPPDLSLTNRLSKQEMAMPNSTPSIKFCPECGIRIPVSRHPNAKYCSRECERAKYQNAFAPKVATGTVGAIAELLVCTDLMGRGWSVFRAQSPSCPCDLIAMSADTLYRIEVRTARLSADGTGVAVPFSANDVGRSDVLASVLQDGTIYYAPDPFSANTRDLSLPRRVLLRLGLLSDPEDEELTA